MSSQSLQFRERVELDQLPTRQASDPNQSLADPEQVLFVGILANDKALVFLTYLVDTLFQLSPLAIKGSLRALKRATAP